MTRQRLYLDNSATTFPKPPEVLAAMTHYATVIGASAGRGGYAEARESRRVLDTCRERLNQLFNGQNPNHFIFTLNCSDALNLAIQGTLRPGDHAITSYMDHNSVLRPLHALKSEGRIDFTAVRVDPENCLIDPADIQKAIRPNTKLIAIVHASNVTGTLQPIRAIGQIARAHGIPFLVDCAQSGGHVPMDVQADHIDLLAMPGHKGLLGPQGTGALYLRPGLENDLRPLRFGGTGSSSEFEIQPDFMPDKFESGSHNAIGIAGLSAGVAWILSRTVTAIYEHDQELCQCFLEGVADIENLRILGTRQLKHRIGVFSLRLGEMDPVALAHRLELQFGILARPGLHCAPLAHQTLGTSPLSDPAPAAPGATRLSFGPFLQPADVQYAAEALTLIAAETHSSPRPVPA